MRRAKFVVPMLLAACLIAGPSSAASLGSILSGVTGSTNTGGTNTGSVGVPGVATVSLNNNSSGTTGNATALGGGGSTINVGLSSVLGGNSNLGVTLPGTGISTVDSTLGTVANTVNGITGNGGVIDSLVPGLGLPGLPGGVVPPGDTTVINYGGGGGTAGAYGFLGGPGCSQDTRGLAQLLQMKYTRQAFNSWARAANVQVVPVKVCAQIRRQLNNATMANASIGALRGMAAADPLISTSLSRTRYNAGNVLGVAQRNGTLTVYVY